MPRSKVGLAAERNDAAFRNERRTVQTDDAAGEGGGKKISRCQTVTNLNKKELLI